MEVASLMEGEWSCYEVVSLMEGEWSCYRGGHFNGGRMVIVRRMVMLQFNGGKMMSYMEVASLMEGAWSCYRGGV